MSVLESGSSFAGHRIERLLGSGGMGEVYLATSERSGQIVALKVLAESVAHDPQFSARFVRESRIAREVDHPHVVKVLDSGEHLGRLFMSTTYIEGPDLSAVLALEGRLHPGHAALIVAQIGDALAAAAGEGLVHRDVKPGNIFITAGAEPHAYLGDFGLSKHVSSTSGLTKTGQWLGTIDYASPEQLQGAPVDQRTDIYALGAVLYRALAGVVPYDLPRDVDKMLAHLSSPPAPLDVELGLPPGFASVVERATAKSPDDRYQDASELGRDALAAAADAGPPPPWQWEEVVEGNAPIDPDAPTVA
ncbi:MAG TPA: serine/threonine-protein kinase [Solirubrobacterales bacterium]|nr:serine/threonine-protein kinase [Solirubrobacterales bacterium]